eukprot:1357236-Prymnesium_polylepis.2
MASRNGLRVRIHVASGLVHTKYVASHYLDRQPPPNASAHGVCYTPYSEMSDLFQDPAPIGGITNNWLVFNSSIGEPFRLEGPDDFQHPTWLTIQDYLSFEPVEQHEPHTFDVPPGCKPPAPAPLAAAATSPPAKVPLLGRLRPHHSNENLTRALRSVRSRRAAQQSE